MPCGRRGPLRGDPREQVGDTGGSGRAGSAGEAEVPRAKGREVRGGKVLP